MSVVFGGFVLKRIDRGLFVGRFQPFHLGHLEAVKYILSKEGEVVIVVGSAQYSHSLENPFTAGERVEMISRALSRGEVPPSKYYLISVEDVNVHAVWVSHLVSRVPRFLTVYSNESLTRRLFQEAGYQVESIPFFERSKYSATEIRKLILEGKPWECLTPHPVSAFIKSINGDQRMKALASNDKNPPSESSSDP